MEPRRYETCNDRGVHDLAYCPEGHYFESFEHVHVTELVPSPRVEIQRVPRLRDDRTANVGNHDGNVGNHDGNPAANVGNNVGNPAANVGNHVGNTKIQLNETEEKVLELVIEDQSLSAQRISEILGVGKRQTERTLKSLREKGLIFREGGTRGFWKILEVPQDQ